MDLLAHASIHEENILQAGKLEFETPVRKRWSWSLTFSPSGEHQLAVKVQNWSPARMKYLKGKICSY